MEKDRVLEEEYNIAEFITDRFDNLILEKSKEQYPAHTNWASNLGHPCVRYLVHSRLDWKKKDTSDLSLQKRFEEGKRQEKDTCRMLDEIGIEVLERGVHFDWKKYQISGKLDGIIEYFGVKYPMDIKSCSPFIFGQINSIEDIKNSNKFYIRKYLTQLMIYMMDRNTEKGLFVFKGKSSGDLKPMILTLDYELAEEAIQKAEKTNEYVAKEKYPDRIAYDPEICDWCWFRTECLPPKENIKGITISNDVNFIEQLRIREGLKESHSEYGKVDKRVKAILKAQGDMKLFAGDFMITGSDIHKKTYVVPESDSIRWNIKNLKEE